MAIRSEQSRQAILQSTMKLLDEREPGSMSVQQLSIERIAREAGVSKTTIYRWWPDKAAVIIDTFLENHILLTPDARGPAAHRSAPGARGRAGSRVCRARGPADGSTPRGEPIRSGHSRGVQGPVLAAATRGREPHDRARDRGRGRSVATAPPTRSPNASTPPSTSSSCSGKAPSTRTPCEPASTSHWKASAQDSCACSLLARTRLCDHRDG